MTINWRAARRGEIAKVGTLMRWPGYPDRESLGGPFVCFNKEGSNCFYRALYPMKNDGLKIYQPKGYILNEKMDGYGLQWADPVKKPTIILI